MALSDDGMCFQPVLVVGQKQIKIKQIVHAEAVINYQSINVTMAAHHLAVWRFIFRLHYISEARANAQTYRIA